MMLTSADRLAAADWLASQLVRDGDCRVFRSPGVLHAKVSIRIPRSERRLVGVLVHRLAWELGEGPIPVGLSVLHSCDNPPCCWRPHLFLGTTADNMADKVAKGRQSRGEANHGGSKLTEEIVRLILRREQPARAEAERHGVSPEVIYGIRQGRRWRHVQESVEAARKERAA